ncbi:choline dehydrogenase [Thiolinea disciformis]|uniref:choline dehydrogenase n=1 Tax=Thiolinea disciformis TaxID=125614 RepID=UPI00037E106D|nr:choline dehydrogenase [Thiolinea disciformis]
MNKAHYDYIIVGAGSAGCVLANRLTESGEYKVLLLEMGGSDKHIFIQMPTALSYPMSMERFAWQFHTEREPGLDGRSLHCPRGKVLGGGSSINGMVYVRGHARDFDEWESLGAKSWSYQDCLPYFRRAETWQDGADAYRGAEGPLYTCGGNNMRLNPLYRAFIDAGINAGYPESKDVNGYQQEGFGPMQMTVKNGVRCSTSLAYLKPALERPNLSVKTGVLVHKVMLEKRKAIGIEYEIAGQLEQVYCNAEVIMAAGSIGSPTILERSGIGKAEALSQAGIKVAHALEGVGENLQDHIEVYFQIRCSQPITLNSQLDWFHKGLIGARWLLFKDGLGATNHFESCAFIRSRAGLEWPDIQYHFLPAAMRYDGKAAFEGHGFQVHVGPNKPKSRGFVHVRSHDPKQAPRILFNYLQDKQDRVDWRACIRLTREILKQPALADYYMDEIQPSDKVQTDAEIDAWVRSHVESAYHPAGSCRMGATDDALAVVDPECKVRGIAQLRVVDSSIFPTLTNGNLNAPTIMVAEKAADLILGHTALAKANAPVWINPNYLTSQR